MLLQCYYTACRISYLSVHSLNFSSTLSLTLLLTLSHPHAFLIKFSPSLAIILGCVCICLSQSHTLSIDIACSNTPLSLSFCLRLRLSYGQSLACQYLVLPQVTRNLGTLSILGRLQLTNKRSPGLGSPSSSSSWTWSPSELRRTSKRLVVLSVPYLSLWLFKQLGICLQDL